MARTNGKSPAAGWFSSMTTTEQAVTLGVGLLALSGLCTAAAARWSRIVAWMLTHHWIVPPHAHPVVRVPGAAGAGLDGTRTVLVVAALVIVLVTAVRLARTVAETKARLADEDRKR